MLATSVLSALLIGALTVSAQRFDLKQIDVHSDDDLLFVENVITDLTVIPEEISAYITEIGDRLNQLVKEWDVEAEQKESVFKEKRKLATKSAFSEVTDKKKKTSCKKAQHQKIDDLMTSKRNEMAICAQAKISGISMLLRNLYNVEQTAINSANELSKKLALCTLLHVTERNACLEDLRVLTKTNMEQINAQITSLSADIHSALNELQTTLSDCITDSLESNDADIENETKEIELCISS